MVFRISVEVEGSYIVYNVIKKSNSDFIEDQRAGGGLQLSIGWTILSAWQAVAALPHSTCYIQAARTLCLSAYGTIRVVG